jgi:hypothetical protein
MLTERSSADLLREVTGTGLLVSYTSPRQRRGGLPDPLAAVRLARPTVLQATAARLSTSCVTRTYAAVLVAVDTVIPRISLTEPVGEHLIRRNGRTVQTCPGVAVFWDDVPGMSFFRR